MGATHRWAVHGPHLTLENIHKKPKYRELSYKSNAGPYTEPCTGRPCTRSVHGLCAWALCMDPHFYTTSTPIDIEVFIYFKFIEGKMLHIISIFHH